MGGRSLDRMVGQMGSSDGCECVPMVLMQMVMTQQMVGMRADTRGVEVFEDESVKVGKKTCTCDFSFTMAGNKVKKAAGTCDKKCGGNVKSLTLNNDDWSFKFGVGVKKGKVKMGKVTAVGGSTGGGSGGSGSGGAGGSGMPAMPPTGSGSGTGPGGSGATPLPPTGGNGTGLSNIWRQPGFTTEQSPEENFAEWNAKISWGFKEGLVSIAGDWLEVLYPAGSTSPGKTPRGGVGI